MDLNQRNIRFINSLISQERNLNNEQRNNSTINSLEQLINCQEGIFLNERNKVSLENFKKMNVAKFLEDILYYFSSPEDLKNYKRSTEEGKNYEFFKDLESEKFLAHQNKRIENIINIQKLNPFIKKKKLSQFNDFRAKNSFAEKNNENLVKVKSASLIQKKMKEYENFILKEKDENQMILYLNELKQIFKKNIIDMESLGMVQFNFIENNLDFILNSILYKLKEKNELKLLNTFISDCIEIFWSFKSTNMFFYTIRLLKENESILDLKLQENDESKIFIPNNCLNFEKIYNSQYLTLINDLKKYLIIRSLNENDEKHYAYNFTDYWTLNYENILFMFIKLPYKQKKRENQNNTFLPH